MGLLDSILGAMSGKTDSSGGASQLIGILGGLLAQSGGLQGLANKFSQSGQGDTFSSWVGMGFLAAKFKKSLVPTMSMLSLQSLASIPPKPRIFWPNTCQRSSTNLRQKERLTLLRITSRAWLIFSRRSCKALEANLRRLLAVKCDSSKTRKRLSENFQFHHWVNLPCSVAGKILSPVRCASG